MVKRPGHTLVEALVALLLLSYGVLGAARVLGTAAATLGVAAMEERAVALGAAVLDSIVAAPVLEPGMKEEDGLRLTWTSSGSAEASLVTLEIVPAAGSRRDGLVLVTYAAPPLPLPPLGAQAPHHEADEQSEPASHQSRSVNRWAPHVNQPDGPVNERSEPASHQSCLPVPSSPWKGGGDGP